MKGNNEQVSRESVQRGHKARNDYARSRDTRFFSQYLCYLADADGQDENLLFETQDLIDAWKKSKLTRNVKDLRSKNRKTFSFLSKCNI